MTGTVARHAPESWPGINRNRWPACAGIRNYILSTHGEWPGDNTTPTLSYTAAFNSYNQGHSALWTCYSGVDTSSPMVDTTGLTHANGAEGSAAITLTGVTSGDLTKIVARDTASAADVSINGQTASIEAGSAFNSV